MFALSHQMPGASEVVVGVLHRLRRLLRRPARTYEVVSVQSETTDIRIEHASGVVVQIEHDGTVILSTPGNMALHADGDLRITSDTHIGLAAPRIDLN
ncbi:MAG: hypothetical protein AAFV53_15555 [Myxococcota bacterium]